MVCMAHWSKSLIGGEKVGYLTIKQPWEDTMFKIELLCSWGVENWEELFELLNEVKNLLWHKWHQKKKMSIVQKEGIMLLHSSRFKWKFDSFILDLARMHILGERNGVEKKCPHLDSSWKRAAHQTTTITGILLMKVYSPQNVQKYLHISEWPDWRCDGVCVCVCVCVCVSYQCSLL